MATATLQTVWDCRWSRPGHHITGVSDALQPETTWVCTRDGDRRAVCGDECAGCSRWEPVAAGMAIQLSNLRGAIFSDRVIEEAPAPTAIEVAQAALRAVLVVTALGFVAIGVTVLTRSALRANDGRFVALRRSDAWPGRVRAVSGGVATRDGYLSSTTKTAVEEGLLRRTTPH